MGANQNQNKNKNEKEERIDCLDLPCSVTNDEINREALSIKTSTKKPVAKRKSIKKTIVPMNFRSAIAPLASIIQLLKNKIRKEHVEAIEKTPFKIIFKAFYDLKINGDELKKDNGNIKKILNAYCNEEKGFRIGGQCLRISAKDISVIFGMPMQVGKKAKKEEKTSTNKKLGKAFTHKYFSRQSHVSQKQIVSALKSIVDNENPVDVSDFSYLICVLICCCLFFPHSSGFLNKKTICSLFQEMHTTNWAEKIWENLMSSAQKYNGVYAPGGCTMALLYWLVEHVNIASRNKETEEEIPRFLRWDLSKINEVISKTFLSDIDDSKISQDLLLTDIEEKIIEGDIYDILMVEMNDDSHSGDDYHQAEEDNQAANDNQADVELNGLKDEVKNLKKELQKAKRKETDMKKENEKLKNQLINAKNEAAKYCKKFEEATKATSKKEVQRGSKRKRREETLAFLEKVTKESDEIEEKVAASESEEATRPRRRKSKEKKQQQPAKAAAAAKPEDASELEEEAPKRTSDLEDDFESRLFDLDLGQITSAKREKEEETRNKEVQEPQLREEGHKENEKNYTPYNRKNCGDMISDSELAFYKLSEEIRKLVDIESFWCGLNGFNEKLSQLKEMGINVAKASEQIYILKRIGECERASRAAAEKFEKEVRDQEGKVLDLQTCISELQDEIEMSKDIITNRKSKIETLKKDSRDAVAEFLSVVKRA